MNDNAADQLLFVIVLALKIDELVQLDAVLIVASQNELIVHPNQYEMPAEAKVPNAKRAEDDDKSTRQTLPECIPAKLEAFAAIIAAQQIASDTLQSASFLLADDGDGDGEDAKEDEVEVDEVAVAGSL
eukprot:CAMPEP_0197024866 /NCGR_PEP_ID=MMETSP1384-20130603/5340_1 /TAXON_ID=29189 /ORGANISM="Ammonia sp." /LENGTH=128 /DNA_ID=CAMNT_0042453323 /DNA_START=698 /DNA_END=1085 /DNA_ORIENTATION=-